MREKKRNMRILSVVLVFAMLLFGGNGFAAPLTARAVENVRGVTYTDTRGIVWVYDIIDDKVHIQGAYPDSKNSYTDTVYIPETGTFPSTMGLPVTVEPGAFSSDLSMMKKVVIPDDVRLKANAFAGCEDLSAVEPESRLKDDREAFNDCPKLKLPELPSYFGKEGWMDYWKPENPVPMEIKEDSYSWIGSHYSLTNNNEVKINYYEALELYIFEETDYVVKHQIGENEFLTEMRQTNPQVGTCRIWDFTGSSIGRQQKMGVFYPEYQRLGAQHKSQLKSITFEEGIEWIDCYIMLDNQAYDSLDIYVPQSCTVFEPVISQGGGGLWEPWNNIRIHAIPGSPAQEYCEWWNEGGTLDEYKITFVPVQPRLLTFELEGDVFFYTGEEIHPEPEVVIAGKTLVKDVDYTVVYSEGCVEPGTYKVTVTGSQNYPGEVTKEFYIWPSSDSDPSDPDPTPTPTPSPDPSPDPTPGSDPTPDPSPDPTPDPNPSPAPNPIPDSVQTVYRLYNPNSGEHLYTTDANETRTLASIGWNYEGTAWSAPQTGVGVYRLYSPVTTMHLYTSDRNEVQTLVASTAWQLDNGGEPLFYTCEESTAGKIAIYRLYNEQERMHLLTTDLNEYDILGGLGWNQEGEKLSCLALGDPGAALP